MIRHCVFVKFKPEVTGQEIDALYQRLNDLCDEMDGALQFDGGANVTPETGMDKGFKSGFIIDFKDADARDAYLVDPIHQQIGADLMAASEGGADGIIVFDLDM